jgi:predicted MPP superfamily phosphohydrolase
MAAFYGLQLRAALTVSEVEVPIAGLPPEFDGAGVMLITDLHAGPFLSPAALRGVFDRLQRLQPDLLLLGGDMTTSLVAEMERQRTQFGTLRAPLGVFAVLGNHDHYTGDPAAMRAFMEECGVTVLHNRSVTLQRNDQRITLCGIDDLQSGEPDLERALQNVPDGVTTILLSHNPDIFFEAARRGVALVFSGHTHGGQIRIPGLPVLVRMSRYRLDHGHYETDGAQLVVSRGLGVTGMPLRFACSPEAIFLRLRAAPPA